MQPTGFAKYLVVFVQCLDIFAKCLVVFAKCLVVFAKCLVLFAKCLFVFVKCLVVFAKCLLIFAKCLVAFAKCIVVFGKFIVVFAKFLVVFAKFIIFFALFQAMLLNRSRNPPEPSFSMSRLQHFVTKQQLLIKTVCKKFKSFYKNMNSFHSTVGQLLTYCSKVYIMRLGIFLIPIRNEV